MSFSDDERFMLRALMLAMRGVGRVNPNPLVGAVIVRDGAIIGEGWHTSYGKLHAEREALADCRARGGDPRGATVYVTLEPCCHTGKTPPCTDALIEAGVARVVVGAPDPNPLVAGKGCALLRAAGIEVTEGVCLTPCLKVNRVFFHFIQTAHPYVIAKYAMTLDGKIATRAGLSKWITEAPARKRVHEDRNRYSAVMVGVGTVLADDPSLTCRLADFAQAGEGAEGGREACVAEGECGTGAVEARESEARESAMPKGRNPVRVVCDSRLRTPCDARVVRTAGESTTIIATCVADEARLTPYRAAGCEVEVVPADEAGRVDLSALMVALGARGIDGVILEGGSTLLGAAFDAGIVNAVQAYVAPKVFGGAEAPSPVGGLGVLAPADCARLSRPEVTVLGNDILIECEVI